MMSKDQQAQDCTLETNQYVLSEYPKWPDWTKMCTEYA